MVERYQNQNNPENKMQTFKNMNQSALNYVQSAIENTAAETNDATQNLVNQVMKNQVP
ncbi:hypothetical protein [Neobacillus cucumis]|uniref:hypothetical protein n=1 Tax=Neobacillus cucumis TaxID=1740721 RepID=UPI0019668433|nr:hypothetical protein [Neobacillus cucumis]MBM7652851.1 hypothetical protein [Neobacillus cucumis]MED4226416.1 hypothetical protein [Neobacillus cucumis]